MSSTLANDSHDVRDVLLGHDGNGNAAAAGRTFGGCISGIPAMLNDEWRVVATFGQSFVTSGVPLAQNSALIDAGFDVKLGLEAPASPSYTGQVGERLQDNAVNGRVDWRF